MTKDVISLSISVLLLFSAVAGYYAVLAVLLFCLNIIRNLATKKENNIRKNR